MMGEFKFEINKMIEIAKKMGIEVELNSDTPEFFVVDEKGNEKEIEIEELFPELKWLDKGDEI
jgi:hypothetical protein